MEQPAGDGHPGTEPNCRCWAEHYYGDPAVPDASLQLQRRVEDDATGLAPWSRIETQRRPDGSLAQSAILGRDGTRFLSLFSGTQVAHLTALPSGDTVRLETSNGVQTAYVNGAALLQSAWTARGPRMTRARRHVAFLLDDPSDPNSLFDGPGRDFEPDPILDPNPFLLGPDPRDGLGILGLAGLAYYAMQQAAPAGVGLGDGDEPVIVYKAWESDGAVRATPIIVGSLSAEQVRQSCQRLPEVQAWTDEAAKALSAERLLMGPASWGSRVHKLVKDYIDELKKSLPLAYGDIRAEFSLDTTDDPVFYGKRGSTRLDVFEDRRDDMGAVCVYDIKTGQEGLTPKRVGQIAEVVFVVYGGVMFYIIEVRPTP